MGVAESIGRREPAVVRTPGTRGVIEWKVRPIDPETAMRHLVFYGSLGVAVQQEETSEQQLSRLAAAGRAAAASAEALLKAEQALELEQAQDEWDKDLVLVLQRAATEARRSLARAKTEFLPRWTPREADVAKLVERQRQVVVACVTEARDEGGPWEPIRFVVSEDQADPSRGVVWVGVLDDATLQVLLAAASAPLVEAGRRWARFRDQRGVANA